MAKTRKRDTGLPVLDRGAGAPHYSGDTTAQNGERERIAQRAYQLYVERGGNDGRDLDDWLEAERELARRQGLQRNATSDNPA
jgi:hypothetical protein